MVSRRESTCPLRPSTPPVDRLRAGCRVMHRASLGLLLLLVIRHLGEDDLRLRVGVRGPEKVRVALRGGRVPQERLARVQHLVGALVAGLLEQVLREERAAGGAQLAAAPGAAGDAARVGAARLDGVLPVLLALPLAALVLLEEGQRVGVVDDEWRLEVKGHRLAGGAAHASQGALLAEGGAVEHVRGARLAAARAHEDLVEVGVPCKGGHAARHADAPHKLQLLPVKQDQPALVLAAAAAHGGHDEALVGAEAAHRVGVRGGQVLKHPQRLLQLADVPHLHRLVRRAREQHVAVL
mmetsp:Transcript_40556/g.103856  ORF Transcript_40556/g.103856 Transcript_40556/m.103856 type:complete len:296 (-) Transcript_40556:792-1679(-)